jgi:hypothetical protein
MTIAYKYPSGGQLLNTPLFYIINTVNSILTFSIPE